MKRVKWGVLGTAGIAKGCTIPGMQEAVNCDLYAIAGRNKDKTEAFQKEFGFEKMYLSYDELLDDPQVEAVYIPLPNDLHIEWACRAMEKKKHVLCEKPMAARPEELDKVFKCAKDNGVHLMEAFAYLHSPIMPAIKADIDAGLIGDIQYVESEFLYSDPGIDDIRRHKENYGGAVFDLGCYTTSQITWILPDDEPVDVKAVSTFTKEGVDFFTSAMVKYKSGILANLVSGFTCTEKRDLREDRLIVSGTKGMIKSPVMFNESGSLIYTVVTEEGEYIRRVNALQNYRLEVEQLGRCILNGEKPHVSEEFSKKNAKLIDMILKDIGYFS